MKRVQADVNSSHNYSRGKQVFFLFITPEIIVHADIGQTYKLRVPDATLDPLDSAPPTKIPSDVLLFLRLSIST